MKRPIVLLSFFALLLAMTGGDAFAAPQTKGQQKCLNKVSGSARKVTSSTVRTAVDCVKRGAAGKLPMGVTAQACLDADLKGKIGKARTKVGSTATKECGAPSTPDFGFIDALTVNDSHQDEAIGLVPDLYGNDLDAALVANQPTDAGARCSSALLGQTSKIADTMLKLYLACLKTGLKNGTVMDDTTLTACMDSITSDLKGKVSKSIAKINVRLASGTCPATAAQVFPELDGVGQLCDRYGLLPLDDPKLATCLGNRTRCRVCRTINGAAGLERNCDDFDDGNPTNATCPACPNGLVDSGEECDDGNAMDGDGCSSICVEEFCGDGIINDSGTEQCDDGPGNSDSTPNACRTDCTLPVCGDSVLDNSYGEACDEGGVNTATCDSDCTEPVCGDALFNAPSGEECDDGNGINTDACVAGCLAATCGDGFLHTGFESCDGGECCTGSCGFVALNVPCTGSAGDCVAPVCNGAGSCLEMPANEGDACEDGSACTASSTCASGVCTAGVLSGVGLACEWAVVGSPGNDTRLVSLIGMTSTGGGDWCGNFGVFGQDSSFSGDIVTTKVKAVGPAIQFGPGVTVDSGDILTNLDSAETDFLLGTLPGLVAQPLVASNQVVNKSPAPTFYDTTGTDPRVAKCEAAQNSLAATGAHIASLPSNGNFLNAYQDLPTGPAAPIVAVNVGGLNVFDMNRLSGSADGTIITLDGGGSADTVMVLRISVRFNAGPNWQFNLTGGLTPDHLLFYVSQTSGDDRCAIGINNVGGGTVLCPDQQIHVNGGATWSGAFYGGDSGLNGQLDYQSGTFTYVPFTPALP